MKWISGAVIWVVTNYLTAAAVRVQMREKTDEKSLAWCKKRAKLFLKINSMKNITALLLCAVLSAAVPGVSAATVSTEGCFGSGN